MGTAFPNTTTVTIYSATPDSQKAFELYEKRQAVTEVDDWLEAERLVKMQLLHAGQGAGSV